MIRKILRKVLAAGCAASLLMMTSGAAVPAEEARENISIAAEEEDLDEVLSDESLTLSEDEITDGEDASLFSENERIPGEEETLSSADERMSGEEKTLLADDESLTAGLEDSAKNSIEETVGSEIWTVGDGVTAHLVQEGGRNVIYLDSQGGTLWEYWYSELDCEIGSINAVKFTEDTTVMYLPEDSSGLFGWWNGTPRFPNLQEIEFDKADTSNVVNMFYGCSSLVSLDLDSFDTSNVRGAGMLYMFEGCSSLTWLDLGNFDTSLVTSMSRMFYGCSSLEELDLSSFNTAKLSSITNMFYGCSNLKSLNLSKFRTTGIRDMSCLFYNCSSLTSLYLGGFVTSSVTTMAAMFYGCSCLPRVDLSSFNTSNVTTMGEMFAGCSSLKTLDLTRFNTSNVTAMGGMFKGCSSLISLDLSSFKTSNTRAMSHMFYDCSSLTSLDLTSFDTSGITSLSYMFADCSSLTSLNLSSFDTRNVHAWDYAFSGCTGFQTLDLSSLVITTIHKDQYETIYPDKFFGYASFPDSDTWPNLTVLKTPVNSSRRPLYLPKKMYNSDEEYTTLPITQESVTLILKTSIEKASVAGVSLSYGYSGKAYKPALTVKLGTEVLTEGTDYTVKYENNRDPGTAVITIKGKGDYGGTRIKTFEIVDCTSSLVSGKTYQLIPKNNSKTAVSSFSGKMVNNTKVYITDRSNSEAMKFKAIKNSYGTWKFINAKSELALVVQQNSQAVGAGLVLYDQTAKKAQNWKLSKKSDNSFAIMNAVSGYSIAMSDESALKGTTLSMAETASSGLQCFYVAETAAVSTPYSGTRAVKASANKLFALNIASSSKNDGANVNLYSYSNINAKKFKFLYSGGGYYRLVNVNSGMCLTVKGDSDSDGANVIQSKWGGLNGQRWKVRKNTDGTVTLTNALGTNLHLVSSKAANGTNIVAKAASSSKAQRWYLQ